MIDLSDARLGDAGEGEAALDVDLMGRSVEGILVVEEVPNVEADGELEDPIVLRRGGDLREAEGSQKPSHLEAPELANDGGVPAVGRVGPVVDKGLVEPEPVVRHPRAAQQVLALGG